MERSLSVLLPVRNAQSTLAASVQGLLEVLPDLTGNFEVVIADDGSTDATIEVAQELATRYPQVIAVRHARALGRVVSIRTALGRSTGQIIFLQDEDCGLGVEEIHRLWRAMDEHDIVLGRVGPSPEPKWPAWRRTQRTVQGGLQMLSRRMIGPIAGALADQTTLLEALSEQGYAWHELELADRTRRARPRASALAHRLLGAGVGAPHGPTRADSPSSRTSGPKRPNYLTRLKDFALGE